MGAKREPWCRSHILFKLAIPLVIFVAREIHLALTARRGTAVDYAARMVDDGYRRQGGTFNSFNGWFELVAAAEQLRQIRNDAFAQENDEPWPAFADWPFDAESILLDGSPAVVRERTREVIARLEAEGAFDRMDAALQRAVIVAPVHDHAFSQMAPYQSNLRDLVRLREARAHLLLQEGRFAEAYEDLRQQLRLASALSRQGGATEYGFADGVAVRTAGFMSAALTHGDIPAEDAEILLGMLDEHCRLAPPGDAVRTELHRVSHLIQWQYTDDGNGDGRYVVCAADDPPMCCMSTGPVDKPHPIDNLAGRLMPSKKEEMRRTETVFARFESLAAASFDQRGEWRPLIEDLRDRLQEERCFHASSAAHRLAGFIDARDRSATMLDGIRLHLAIESYRARHGRLPSALAELAPSILPAIPTDSLTGADFCYRLCQDGEEDRNRRYLLYSIGTDGTDDGGRPHPERPGDALLKDRAVACDYVINAPRTPKDWDGPQGLEPYGPGQVADGPAE